MDELDLDDFVSREEAIKFLDVTEMRFNELLNSGELSTILSRTKPQPGWPFEPLSQHPDNEEWYSMAALQKLKVA